MLPGQEIGPASEIFLGAGGSRHGLAAAGTLTVVDYIRSVRQYKKLTIIIPPVFTALRKIGPGRLPKGGGRL